MSASLLAAWQRRGPLATLPGSLLPLRRAAGAAPTGLSDRAGAQRERLPVRRVLVVGNVVVGGAGKTPTVIALLRHLRERGWTLRRDLARLRARGRRLPGDHAARAAAARQATSRC